MLDLLVRLYFFTFTGKNASWKQPGRWTLKPLRRLLCFWRGASAGVGGCARRLSSSCGEQGLLLVVESSLLTAVASCDGAPSSRAQSSQLRLESVAK